MAGTDLLPADLWLWVYLSCCPSVSKTHTLMPLKLIWATQAAGFRTSLLALHRLQFLSEKMDRQPRPARAVEPLGHLWYCASTNPTIVHSTFGVAYILLVPHPWFGVFHCPGTPGRNERSRTPGLGVTWCCPTSSQHHQHPAALTQARTGRHECTCRGVVEAETIISRLWLTATFPFGHSSFPFRFPLWRDPYLRAEERGDALCTYRAPHAERGRPHVSPVHHRNVSYEAWEAQPYTWPEDNT